jgi:hypothetical protein
MRPVLPIACCLLLLSGAGCSLLTVTAAPRIDPQVRPVPCTQSRAAPLLDTLPATALLLAAGGVLAADGDEENLGPPIAGGIILVSLPFVISAIYGYSKTSACQRMNERPVSKSSTI